MKDKIFYGICFGIILVVLCFDFYIKEPPEVFETDVGQKVFFTGMVIEEPEVKENSQGLIVEVSKENEKTKILVSTNSLDEFFYGDYVKFNGVLKKPENFITDTGKEFDYVNYLKKDGIFYQVSFANVSMLGGWQDYHGNVVKRTLLFVKRKFLEQINWNIPEPESLLMGGLILGERSNFSDELREDFIRTGTIHIVALSGYNITIVAQWFMSFIKLFKFLPVNFGIGAGILSIILFVVMTGSSSTALRAGIMAILVLIARVTGRTYDVGRALILAGVGMIIFNPMILLYDVSFQLSFIATVAVIYLTPRIEKYFMWVTKRFGLRDIVSVTFSAYIFVLPFILYKMGNLSLLALPANILVLPFIPITMVFGFLTGFAGIIFDMLAIPFGYVSYALLHYELFVIKFLSSLPFASFSIPNFPLFLTIAIYAYFVYFLFGRSIKEFFS